MCECSMKAIPSSTRGPYKKKSVKGGSVWTQTVKKHMRGVKSPADFRKAIKRASHAYRKKKTKLYGKS